MIGFLRMFEEEARREEIRNRFVKAVDLGKKECVKCGCCCHLRPCIPTPDELRKIADFLKLTPKELINFYFAIDKRNEDNYYYVKPIGTNQTDLKGKFIPCDRTYDEGKCIFLGDNNLCKIQEVKPKMAKLMGCWKDEECSNDSRDSWQGWGVNLFKKEFDIEISESEDD